MCSVSCVLTALTVAVTALHVSQVAEAVMSSSIPPSSCMARIMLFTGGPTTEGMGKIVNRDLTEEVRRCGSRNKCSGLTAVLQDLQQQQALGYECHAGCVVCEVVVYLPCSSFDAMAWLCGPALVW